MPSSSSSHRSDGSNRISTGATPSIHAPTLYATKNSGATVIGLLIHAIATETGRLQRTRSETPAARTIWKGIGTHAMNRPFDTAHATELRFRCQRSALNNVRPKMRRNDPCPWISRIPGTTLRRNLLIFLPSRAQGA